MSYMKIMANAAYQSEMTMKMLLEFTDSDKIYKLAVAHGLGIVADELRIEINQLETTKDLKAGDESNMRYCYEWDKKALLANMGITRLISGEDINGKVGFDGYYRMRNGKLKAVPLIANAINAGTSFMVRQPFLDKTYKNVKKRVQEEMAKKVNERYEEIQKKYE